MALPVAPMALPTSDDDNGGAGLTLAGPSALRRAASPSVFGETARPLPLRSLTTGPLGTGMLSGGVFSTRSVSAGMSAAWAVLARGWAPFSTRATLAGGTGAVGDAGRPRFGFSDA